MLNKILQWLSIRCAHRKLSQPFTALAPAPSRSVNAEWDGPGTAPRHYVVCLDCGTKFDYDWTNMRMARR